MWSAIGSVLAKILASLYGEWSRDRANTKAGAATFAASTAEATLENLRKVADVDRAVLGDEPSDWVSRVRRDAGFPE